MDAPTVTQTPLPKTKTLYIPLYRNGGKWFTTPHMEKQDEAEKFLDNVSEDRDSGAFVLSFEVPK